MQKANSINWERFSTSNLFTHHKVCMPLDIIGYVPFNQQVMNTMCRDSSVVRMVDSAVFDV